jgi:hypothetical protein
MGRGLKDTTVANKTAGRLLLNENLKETVVIATSMVWFYFSFFHRLIFAHRIIHQRRIWQASCARRRPLRPPMETMSSRARPRLEISVTTEMMIRLK